MNAVRSVYVAPAQISSGDTVTVQLSYSARPGARLWIGCDAGFQVGLSEPGAQPGQSIRTAPQPVLMLTVARTGAETDCTLSFNIESSAGSVIALPAQAAIEVT